MTYGIKKSAKFKKMYDLAQRRGWDISELDHAIVILASVGRLGPEYADHQLKSNMKQYRECHIGGATSDWVLIYQKLESMLVLYLLATGTHRELGIGG